MIRRLSHKSLYVNLAYIQYLNLNSISQVFCYNNQTNFNRISSQITLGNILL